MDYYQTKLKLVKNLVRLIVLKLLKLEQVYHCLIVKIWSSYVLVKTILTLVATNQWNNDKIAKRKSFLRKELGQAAGIVVTPYIPYTYELAFSIAIAYNEVLPSIIITYKQLLTFPILVEYSPTTDEPPVFYKFISASSQSAIDFLNRIAYNTKVR